MTCDTSPSKTGRRKERSRNSCVILKDHNTPLHTFMATILACMIHTSIIDFESIRADLFINGISEKIYESYSYCLFNCFIRFMI